MKTRTLTQEFCAGKQLEPRAKRAAWCENVQNVPAIDRRRTMPSNVGPQSAALATGIEFHLAEKRANRSRDHHPYSPVPPGDSYRYRYA